MSTYEERIHRELAQRADATQIEPSEVAALVRANDPLLPTGAVAASVARIRARLEGLGPVDPLLDDPAISDVMINGPGPVWVERGGQLERTAIVVSRGEIEHLIERIVAPLGRRADPLHALVDARLPDGSRVHVVVPPLAVDGPCVTIRRFAVHALPLSAMASPDVAVLLQEAVHARCNLVVSGATGSGKTTLLNALAAQIPTGTRVITVEDAAELRLAADHVVRLESRVPVEGEVGEVTIRELVRNALRMRPDRLIVGEVRGAEAVDLIAALSTGHDGSMSTVHANGAVDALHRLESLALPGASGLPSRALRSQIASAIDLVVHVERSADGGRSVVEVVEVAGRWIDDDPPLRWVVDREGRTDELRRRRRVA